MESLPIPEQIEKKKITIHVEPVDSSQHTTKFRHFDIPEIKFDLEIDVAEVVFPDSLQEKVNGVEGYEKLSFKIEDLDLQISANSLGNPGERFDIYRRLSIIYRSLKDFDQSREVVTHPENRPVVDDDMLELIELAASRLPSIEYKTGSNPERALKAIVGAYENFFSIIVREVVSAISGGEFPDQTFNHFQNLSGKFARGYKRSVKEQVLTSEFYGLDGLVDIYKKHDPEADPYGSKLPRPGRILVGLFRESEPEQRVEQISIDGVDIDLSKLQSNSKYNIFKIFELVEQHGLSPERFVEWIKNNRDIILMADKHQGLSLSFPGAKQGWQNWTLPLYGFSSQNEAMAEYARSVKQVYGKTNPKPSSERIGGGWYTLNMLDGTGDVRSEGWKVSDGSGGADHAELPLIWGSENVPSLNWCSATWAYIPTANKINVLRFKS